MSSNVNSHFVPRFISKPWEIGERELVLCDLRTGRIQKKSSKSALAKRGLNSLDTEQFFSAIESRVATIRDREDKRRRPDYFEIEDERERRALHTLSILQLHRGGVAVRPELSLPSLDETASGGTEFLESLAMAADLQSIIFMVKLPPWDDVCLPETGFFALPLASDIDGWVTPLSPTLLAIRLPRSISVAAPQSYLLLRDIIMTRGGIPTLSVGPNVGSRVVLASSWLKASDPSSRTVGARRRSFQLHDWIRKTDGHSDLSEFGSLELDYK